MNPELVIGDVGKIRIGGRQVPAAAIGISASDQARHHLINLCDTIQRREGAVAELLAAIETTMNLLQNYQWHDDAAVGLIAASQLARAVEQARDATRGHGSSWLQNLRVFVERNWVPNLACDAPGVYRTVGVPAWDETKLAAIVEKIEQDESLRPVRQDVGSPAPAR